MAAVACLLIGGVLTGARALVPGRSAAHPGAAKASLNLPPPPSDGRVWTALGLTADNSVQSVKRAKVSFNVAPFRALAWLNDVVESPPDPDFFWNDATAEIYITDPDTPADHFGEFAPVKVKVLAFGSIPVSAVVHISQLRDATGQAIPFEVKFRFSGAFVKPQPHLPCKPNCRYTEAPQLTGKVDVRVDNVKIDRIPVDVGADCHTAEPATLALAADAGYYSSPDPLYVPPGLYLPFVNGGTLHGPVNVPAFTGCTNGREDLSSIITATVAGPDNELATHQDGPLVEYPPPAPKKK